MSGSVQKWMDMTNSQRSAALQLGYSQESWDNAELDMSPHKAGRSARAGAGCSSPGGRAASPISPGIAFHFGGGGGDGVGEGEEYQEYGSGLDDDYGAAPEYVHKKPALHMSQPVHDLCCSCATCYSCS